jgi:alkane 1-monooxygenase
MLRFQIMHLALITVVFFAFGGWSALWFILAALMGGVLLETVNYIEHYGLKREINERGRYERVMPVHSWNSNHILGRILLFELSRHSDHHYKASKPYQTLESIDDAPQLPTGYPGMMLLATVPPLFFAVMNRRVDNLTMSAAI